MGHGHDYADRSHPEFVAIDIGGDRGALIVHTDPDMHGIEVEISRSGAVRTGAHKQILERRAGGGAAYTAVFDGLEEGTYTLCVGDEPRAGDVLVTPGAVAELDWR